MPGSYGQSKAEGEGCLPGAVLARHRLAKAAWHQGGQGGGGSSAASSADFSAWLHCDAAKWEAFALEK